MKRQPYRSRGETFRSGFSMIEIIVVMATLGVLVSISVSAIQQARETARDLQCRNNLKQVAASSQTPVAIVRSPSLETESLTLAKPPVVNSRSESILEVRCFCALDNQTNGDDSTRVEKCVCVERMTQS